MYTSRKLLIFNKEPRYKHILIQWALKSMSSYWFTPFTSLMFLSYIPCAAWRGTDTKLSCTPGVSKTQDWYFPKRCVRSASSVHTRLIFIPKCVFLSTLQLPVPELSAALVLPLCSPLYAPASPTCSGISPGDATGCQNSLLELSLPGHLLKHRCGHPVQCQALLGGERRGGCEQSWSQCPKTALRLKEGAGR